ncbi:MAG TPA: DUF2721 domain-containing protein [Bacteroidales bacterium]|nr:DUF2721 domain-containing protein [Bacteroidales bacterium]
MYFSITTPALLFSAISLTMLAYTNRFLSYATLVRSLHDTFVKTKEPILLWQIKNLRKRLYLTRSMQFFGISSLLLCVVSMLLMFLQITFGAMIAFGIALVLLIISLILLIWEIQISVHALKIHIHDIEKDIN